MDGMGGSLDIGRTVIGLQKIEICGTLCEKIR
ncbi:unnamed protein product, partial [Allacma fusca]